MIVPLADYYCAHDKQGGAVLSYLETLLPRV